jgi:hypothetical protein
VITPNQRERLQACTIRCAPDAARQLHSLDMSIDEYAKEQDRVPSNVQPFIPRTASSATKTEQAPGPLARRRNVVDNDDDPGRSAAYCDTRV